ncbi:MAG: hypothetical protein ABIX46_14835, partial [Burkholderiaceae bacterium]
MAAITPLLFPHSADSADPWPALATAVSGWAETHGIVLRDAVVLLPYAQLLAPARHAFAADGGWMPRIETTQTLARALGPPVVTAPHELAHDPVFDRLRAAHLLRGLPRGADLERRDPAGFRRAVAVLVETAQALGRAAAGAAPADRVAYWQGARDLLAPVAGPGSTERWLTRIALEWAAVTTEVATDRLHALRPSAWIAVQAGGPDRLTRALLDASPPDLPCALIDVDVDPAAPFDRLVAALDAAGGAMPAVAVCNGFEAEAQAAAAQVLAHVRAGVVPVALIAQDRELVRRIRALLERSQVVLLDETGWKLSTTRAAGQVRRLLDAAAHDATTDVLLDWLKGVPELSHSVDALEAACRRHQITRVASLAGAELDAAASRALVLADRVLTPLRNAPRSAPADWLARLQSALRTSG